MKRLPAALPAVLLLSACSTFSSLTHSEPAPAPPAVYRVPIADPKFPIAASVSVPAGYDTVYISGALPDVADPRAAKGSYESYGSTEVQTMSVLKKLGDALAAQGVGFGDVVAAHVYLAGDPAKNGEIDFAGMNAAFSKYFGSPTQTNKPARAAMKVAALVVPGTLVEIELIAARPPGTKLPSR
jgi:enamine deaminase RidA (YjgF/YER057c/UK114 family)